MSAFGDSGPSADRAVDGGGRFSDAIEGLRASRPEADDRAHLTALGDHGWVGSGTLFGAGLGNDPSEDDFGAVRFEAEDPTRSSWHRGIEQHQHYFDADSESVFSIGRVVDGSGQVNVAGHTSDSFLNGPTDPEWSRDPTSNIRGRSDTAPDQEKR